MIPQNIILNCGNKLAVRYIFTDCFFVYFLSNTILHFAFILFLFSPHSNAHTPMHPCSLTLDKNVSQTLFIVFLSSESDGFPS